MTRLISDKIIRGLIYSLAILVPIVFSPLVQTTFTTPKLFVLNIITVLIIIFWGYKIFIEGRIEYKKTVLNILLTVYAVASILTVIYSISFYSSLYGNYGRFIGIFTVLNLLFLTFVAGNFLDKKSVRVFLGISFITSVLLALYGIFQYFGFYQEYFHWSQDPSARVFSTIGHPDHFGIYLAMSFMLGLGIIGEIKRTWIKLAVIFSLIVEAITLILTGSRSALLALAFSVLIFLLVKILKNSQAVKANLGKILLSLFVIISIFIAGLVIFKSEISQISLIKRTDEAIQMMQKGNIPDRLSWWLSSVEMIKDRPIFGYGLSTFRDVYNTYRRTDYKTLEANGMEYKITPEAAHNEYLNLASTQGIVGLIAFLAVVVYALIRLWKEAKKQTDYSVSLGVICSLIVWLVAVFFGFGVVATYFMFFILLGTGTALNKTQVKTINLNNASKYAITIIVLAIVGFGLYGSIRFVMSDFYYRKAVEDEFRQDYKNSFINYAKAISMRPGEYSLYESYANSLINAAKSDKDQLVYLNEAIKNYEQALTINDLHPSTYFNLGVTYMQLYTLTGEKNYRKMGEGDMNIAVNRAVNNPLYDSLRSEVLNKVLPQNAR